MNESPSSNASRRPCLAALALVLCAAALSAAQSNLPESLKKYSRPTKIPSPVSNPWSKEKALLGRTLFFDPRLSGSGWISCATCHNPGLGWSDGLPKAIGDGMRTLGRRTPTILNAAWSDLLFWDGRADSLEAQALGPVAAPGEMHQDISKLLDTLRCIPGYRSLFARAFPVDKGSQGEKITEVTLAKAIAAFERTVVSGRAPFDEWIAGNPNAISGEARAGFELFNGKAGCARCHSEWNFTDNGFHDIGLKGDDPGRGKFVLVESQNHAFKTPGLRNIDRRGPYMHDGSEATLEEVIEFYDRGGDVLRASLAPEMTPLHLTTHEKHTLLEFLRTLTSEDPVVLFPELPR